MPMLTASVESRALSMGHGFPSPADEDFPLTTPVPDSTSSSSSAFPRSWPLDRTTSDLLCASMPGEVTLQPLASPAQENAPGPCLDSIVGASINPAPLNLVPAQFPSASKASPGLRLPSFEALGIANPRPGFLQGSVTQTSDLLSVGGSINSLGSDPNCLDLSGEGTSGLYDTRPTAADPSGSEAAGQALQNLPQGFLATMTPSDETGTSVWKSIVSVSASGMDSPSTEPGTASQSPAPQTAAGSATQPRIQIQRTDSQHRTAAWLDGATDVILSNLQSAQHMDSPIKVLSHALPCPSISGFAHPLVINLLHNSTPTSPTCWINVFHALPGRFSLADIPCSPPATPGPAVGGDDYFTSKVFDSAVPVLDYQDNIANLPRSPRPAVPPSTINVSIVERYIPPTNANEFSDLFGLSGRSLLVDRLMELSPDNGTLLFIYPTKKGGQTFLREYLGPILDPLLRSMCVVNGLSVDLGSALGRMGAVDSMLSWDAQRQGITQLCKTLSQRSASLNKFHRSQATFSLDYVSKERVQLERSVWAENWWVKQEKSRVREMVSRYFRLARKLPSNSDATPTNLIHEVLDGVATRPYGNEPEPSTGIEVGVFVIRRSA